MGQPRDGEPLVRLSDELYSAIEGRVQLTAFDSVDEYVSFILEEILYSADDADDAEIDAVTEEEVKNRLESLGYIK